MSFEQAEAYLDGLGIDAMKGMAPSLHRIEALCESLNHPERAAPAIHITGTNGKTSTARIATSVLSAAGLSVGTFTSPHLETIRERLTLAGQPISEAAFGEVFDYLCPHLELVEKRLDQKVTYFELLTAMFFLWVAEQPMDAMVVEVGLGGRWDATNVVPATVGVITNVALDHTGLLGRDKESIAREKAGIVKPESVVVTAERDPTIVSIIAEQAAGVGAQTSVIERDFFVTSNKVAVGGRYLSMQTTAAAYEDVYLSLHGSHQGVNAATALEACSRFLPARPPDRELVAEALSNAVVPGRLEQLRVPGAPAPVVLDVAHNPDGMSALVTALLEGFIFDRMTFVVGILADKDYSGMFIEMSRIPCSVVATQPRNVRAVPVERLTAEAEALGITYDAVAEVREAVDAALVAAGRGEIICVTGSHYVVGEARSHLIARPS